MSCLVYLPRDRYTTAVRLKMEAILREAFDGASVDYTTRVSPSRCWPGCTSSSGCRGRRPSPTSTTAELRAALVDATRTWDEDLAEAAARRVRRGGGARLIGRLRQGASPRPTRRTSALASPSPTCATSRRLTTHRGLDPAEPLPGPPGGAPGERRFKLYRRGPLSLTAVLPLFTHLGRRGRSTSGRTRSRRPTAASVLHLRLRAAAPQADALGRPTATTTCASVFQDAFAGGVGRARRERRLQRPGARRRADLAAGRHPARRRQVPAADRRRTFSQDYVESAPRRQRRHRRGARRPLRGPLRPRPVPGTGAAEDERAAAPERARRSRSTTPSTRSRASTTTGSSGPSWASSGPPCGRTTSSQVAEPGDGQSSPTCRFKLDPKAVPGPAGAPADVRDLGLQPAGRGRAPALRQGRPRRPALVRPARGLPHRDPRAGQGADGQERRHRADRLQGRLLRQGAARPGRRP